MATLGSAPLPEALLEAEAAVAGLCSKFVNAAQPLLSQASAAAGPAAGPAHDDADSAAASLKALATAVRGLSKAIQSQNFSSQELDQLKGRNQARQAALKGLLHDLDLLIDSSWRSIISYHEANPSPPRDVDPQQLIAYASRIRTNIFDGLGVLPSQPPAPQMWHMQNSAWSNYTNNLLAQAADEYRASASSRRDAQASGQDAVAAPLGVPAAAAGPSGRLPPAIPPDWNPGDPLPIPAFWQPGDPLPVAIPPGWQPGDPLPTPGWKPGEPIPPLPFPPGWKQGDPLPEDGFPLPQPDAAVPAALADPKPAPQAAPVDNPSLEIDWLLAAEETSEEYSEEED